MADIDIVIQTFRYLQALDLLKEKRLKDWNNPMECLDDIQFHARYRLSKETTRWILDNFLDRLLGVKGSNYLPPLLQLLVVLRYFATGCFQLCLGELSDLPQSSVSNSIKRVAAALASQRAAYVKFPTDTEACAVRQKFSELANFPGVTGAIDCMHVGIARPPGDDFEVYRNQKGFFSINVQAVCDSDLVFTSIVVRWPGSVHDSRVFENSLLRMHLEEGNYPGYLLGDSGYPCLPYLLTPVLNPALPQETRYNHAHASTRKVINRAFELLKRRFTCLESGLRLKLNTSLTVIIACTVLHNIAFQHNDFIEDDALSPEEPDEVSHASINPAGQALRRIIIDRHFS